MGHYRTKVTDYCFNIKKSVFSDIVNEHFSREMDGWNKWYSKYDDDEIICVRRFMESGYDDEPINIFAHVDGHPNSIMRLIEDMAPHVAGCGFIYVTYSHTSASYLHYGKLCVFEENIDKPIIFRAIYDEGLCEMVETNIKDVFEDVNTYD